MKEIEKWCIIKYLDIKENMYAVSNYGGIKNINTGKVLHPWLCKGNGYMYGTFMTNDNKTRSVGIHVLVSLHFIDIPDELKVLNEPLVPNHKDFDRKNNFVGNLEWMTYSMNNEYNRLHGHWKHSENAPNAQTTNLFVEKICELMEQGYYNKEIMKILDMEKNAYTKSLLTRIRTGKEWKEISKKYNITNKNTLRNSDTELIKSICEMLSKGYPLKQMRNTLGISDDKESKRKFKCLVYGIKTRRNYKDISKNYVW